jgi:hypothetical protein
MEELFRPVVSVRVETVEETRSTNPNAALLSRLVHLVPLVLAVLFFLKAGQLQLQVQELRDALAAPPVTHTAPSAAAVEYVTTTVTHTSTHYTDPPSLRWQTVTEEATPSSRPPPPAPVDEAEPPMPTAIPAPISTVILQPTAAPPMAEWAPRPEDAVALSLPQLRFPDFLRMEWKLPEREEVANVVMLGLRKVWNLWQVVANYPLPPPE